MQVVKMQVVITICNGRSDWKTGIFLQNYKADY